MKAARPTRPGSSAAMRLNGALPIAPAIRLSRAPGLSRSDEAAEARERRLGKFTPGDFEFEVRRSYAGLGLRTKTAIPKGACVIEYWGRLLTKDEENTSNSKYLFAIDENTTIDGSPRANLARYINHSCRPNCEPEIYRKRVFIMARRNIKAGEELSYNYGEEYFDNHIKPHGCRCIKCDPERHEKLNGG